MVIHYKTFQGQSAVRESLRVQPSNQREIIALSGPMLAEQKSFQMQLFTQLINRPSLKVVKKRDQFCPDKSALELEIHSSANHVFAI
jgi:hypothetical protein